MFGCSLSRMEPSILVYLVRLKKGIFNMARVRSFQPKNELGDQLDSLRIFTCHINHSLSWHAVGPSAAVKWILLSDQSTSGFICTYQSMKLDSQCSFALDFQNESNSTVGSTTFSIACSYDVDQGIICSPILAADSSTLDEIYLYYVFAHTYVPPTTRSTAPKSVRLTPMCVARDAAMTPVDSDTWPSRTPILIGHGGAGMKHAHYGNGRQWPDNTICAFQRAEQLGLPMVECDASVTRNYQTVLLHHNFTVRFCDKYLLNDTSKRNLTLEDIPDPPVDEKTTDLLVNYSLSELRNMLGRSLWSVDTEVNGELDTLTHPDPLTRFDPLPDAGVHGYALPELADAFRQTSINLGFNVELKYPRETILGKITRALALDEPVTADLPGPHSYFANINKFCDKILDTIWRHAGGRVIMLSSFNADVCAVLRLKQTHLPVLFITRGGILSNNQPAEDLSHVDIRHCNLGIAISWAHTMDLAGVVTLGTHFGSDVSECAISVEQSTKWAEEMAHKGLACFVYGSGVSECSFMDNAMKFGLSGVIIDRVDSYVQECEF